MRAAIDCAAAEVLSVRTRGAPGRGLQERGNLMIFDRLTWIGFMIVAGGWVLVLAAPQLNDAAAHLSARPLEAAPPINVAAIAQCAILSGFGVEIIGALQTGFGALDRFFAAVLARSGQARAQTSAPSQPIRWRSLRHPPRPAGRLNPRPRRPRPSPDGSRRRQEKSLNGVGSRIGPMFFSSMAASRSRRCWGDASSPRFGKRRNSSRETPRLQGAALGHECDDYRKRFGHAEFA